MSGGGALTYTIPAIPTVYRGRRYRSRLEAKWAAFFDLLHWHHEYEPFDLSGWIPDFLVQGGALAEIKPVQSFDAAVARKMQAAVSSEPEAWLNLRCAVEAPHLLLLPLAPFESADGRVCIGWSCAYGQPDARWAECVIGWLCDDERPSWSANAYSPPPPDPDLPPFRWWAAVVDVEDRGPQTWGGRYFPLEGYVEHTLELWAKASNAVQWKPPA
jgi:hypothetical protein